MKKTSEVTREHADYTRIIGAVIRRIGRDSVDDVNNHGIDGGFSGFTYYADTVAFWRAYKSEIRGMLKDDADNFGESILSMVRGFRCLNGNYNEDEIGAALYGRYDSSLDVIYNALAWYAAETVCRWFDE